ncbi:T9SS type A sorting domain-containing protein [Runella sp. CRIBMP]|uniref:sialate O-acetylesterase n=1 Tax=Runella sp. CRIBMP TaxID=2683261 RepID=UPI0014126A72|nr:sialate O-acetylesterase [Runella sp. CRIBMP]NBB20469.1 T9SS type A sorting domain-containing protein [Runella sp. CRIBMP]
MLRVRNFLKKSIVRCCLFSAFFPVFAIIPVFSQVGISFPTSRLVFQRSANNSATFVVSGTYQQSIPDQVEAALVPFVAGQGTATNWQIVEKAPVGGVYSGTISGGGGWYKLKVRVVRNGKVTDSTEVDRIGIGEVFLVAGQSNARGIQNYGAPAANDDRVSCFNYLNASFDPNELPEPTFSHLNSDSYIAPYGYSAWSWGALGDLLVSRFNVPVLFYNVALEGTTSRSWRESSTGYASNPYTGGVYINQLPYSQLKVVLRQFTSLTGVRAVLWHQGESDTQFNLSESEIVSNLQQVIGQSRNDAGQNISWVVSKVSYNMFASKAVINAQNTVINSTTNVFEGPSTDNIQIPRPDGVHIQGNALITLAQQWNQSLNSHFFNQSNPIAPLLLPVIKVGCTDDSRVKLMVEGNFTEVSWNNGERNNTILASNGVYRVKAKDSFGHFMYSSSVSVGDNTRRALPKPSTPSILTNGNLVFCEGGNVTFSTPQAAGYRWSNGATSQSIVVMDAANYSVQIKDDKGCWSDFSGTVKATVNPIPSVPSVTAKGALTFCADKSVTLAVEENSVVSTSTVLEWNSGQKTGTIVINQSGDYAVRAVNQYNCASAYSNTLRVTVNPLPNTPTIVADGVLRFCEGSKVILSTDSFLSTVWNEQYSTPKLTVTASGRYTAQVTDTWGCKSLPSKEVIVEVNPVPARPVITKAGPFAIGAEGNYLPNINFRWTQEGVSQNTVTTQNILKPSQTGNYTVVAFYDLDAKNTCASLPSFVYSFVFDFANNGLSVYPNPSRDGAFSIEMYKDIKNARLQLINAEGKQVHEESVPELIGPMTLKFSTLPPGIYFLKIQGENQIPLTKKLWFVP